jgi:mannose-6-phosphate isomerase
MQLYPMLFQPVFKDYIWGGRRLKQLGRELPEGKQIAESWEIAAHEDGMVLVENGAFAGKSLQWVLDLLGENLIGSRNDWALELGKFPWLVKLLDANDRLSVQVHPEDAYAREHENGELGKTEMWVVLEAEPEAAIIYGLSQNVSQEGLQKAIHTGCLSDYLNQIQIQRGDHICVPAGTLHAILAGAVIAEIQQNSNVTYRVFDWNRMGDNGESRELHVEKALDVINFSQVGCTLPEPAIIESTGAITRQRLCRNQYFTTERILFQPGAVLTGECDGSTLEIWGVIDGEAEIAGKLLSAVRFVLLPASLGLYKVHAPHGAVLLRTFVDD